jgi:ATP-dependent DNA helicase RecQ
VRRNDAEFLFLAPEQLARDDVLEHLADLHVAMVVVDEAHCVSAWGHDFRPDYLRLAPVIDRLGRPPVLAMTATAALPVRRDIVAQLRLRDPVEVIASFDRPELHLAVDRSDTDAHKRESIRQHVVDLVAARRDRQQGIVYTATRKGAELIAADLREDGVVAQPYHAGRSANDRREVHSAFLSGDVEVVVATSAFGMGIDKPDVRFVVHASIPESLDTYYQEIGRAGRDGEPAEIVLCYRPEDLALQKFLTAHRADEDALNAVASALRDAARAIPLRELGEHVDLGATRRTRAVNLLQAAESVTADSSGRVTWTKSMSLDAAVGAAVEIAEQRQQLIRSRIEMMRGYAETTGCRRQFLLGYFGEQLDEPCGRCDTCDAGTATAVDAIELATDTDLALAANAPVRHAEWGDGVVMSVESDRVTVLFDQVGYKTLSIDAVVERDLLEEV